jgi:hypothetical protein
VGVAIGSVGVTTGRLGVGTGRVGNDGVGIDGVGIDGVGSAVPDPVGVGEGLDPVGLGLAPGRDELAWSRDASLVMSGNSGASICGLSAR